MLKLYSCFRTQLQREGKLKEEGDPRIALVCPSLRAVLCLCVVLLRCFRLIYSFNRCGQFLAVLVKGLLVLYDVTAKGSYNMCVINHKCRQYIGDEFDGSVIREQIP